MLAETQLLINPPFAIPAMTITLTHRSGLYRICLDSLCRESPDWWQVLIWLEQFRRMQVGELAE